MKVVIIQDREVFKSCGKYYRLGLTEFIKYKDIFDNFSYLAPLKEMGYNHVENMHEVDDYVNFINLPISKKTEMLFLSKRIRKTLNMVIDTHDVFIVKMPSLAIGEYVLKEALKQNKKVVVEVVGCAWDSFWYYGLKGKILASYNFFKNKFSISKAEYAVYVTKCFLQERYPIKGKSIACSNVYITDTKEKSINFNERNLAEDGIKIVTTSPVDVKFRGHSIVFKALCKLRKNNIKFSYYLIGGGNPNVLKSKAKSLGIEDSIIFLGKRAHTEINELLDSCDLYIHPSKAEGLPRALIEAMSRGLPCIAANTAGNPELLSSKYIYKKNSYRALYDILISLDISDLNKMSIENLETSREYLYDVLTDKRKDFYGSIITNRGNNC